MTTEVLDGVGSSSHTHVRIERCGRPGAGAIVLLHGFGDDGDCWRPYEPFLADRYDLAMLDANGHGRSGVAPGGLTADRVVADAVAVIERLGHPVVLIGHSMGAHTAVLVAGERPDLVVGVVAEDPPWSDGFNRPERSDRPTPSERWILGLQTLGQAALEAQCRSENPGWAEAELAPWAASKLRMNCALFDASINTVATPWLESVGRLSGPTLLLRGDPERRAIVTAEAAGQALAAAPCIEVVHVPGAGHCIRRDQPAAYHAAVAAFLLELLGELSR